MELSYELRNGSSLRFIADRTCGHGGIVWDAAVVLAETVQRFAVASDPPLRVLELGAGCGLPGLVAAAGCGAHVILSDRPALVPLLQANADRAAADLRQGGSIQCVALNFGQRLQRLPATARPPYDLILASDILGCADEGAFEGILKTLADVFAASVSSGGRLPTVLMAYRPRAPWESAFFVGARAKGWGVRLRATWAAADVAGLKHRMLRSPASSCVVIAAGVAEATRSGGAASEVPCGATPSTSAEVPGSESTPSDPESEWGGGAVEVWELTAAAAEAPP